MKTKLVLLKRIRPVVFEIHVGSINQANNLLITTGDLEFAKHIVQSFNGFEALKKKLKKTEELLKQKEFLLDKVSKASKKKISELQSNKK